MRESREIKGEYFIRALGGFVIYDVNKYPLPPLKDQKHLYHYYRVNDWNHKLYEKCEHQGVYDFTIYLENDKIYEVLVNSENYLNSLP